MQGYRLLVTGALLIVMSSSTAVVQATAALGAEPQNVSVIQLLGTPERFHGKRVRVVGWWIWEREESVLYLHREDAEYLIDGIWLDVDSKRAREWASAQNGYCVIEGEFNARVGNDYSSIPTSIIKITRLERVRSRTELRAGPTPR